MTLYLPKLSCATDSTMAPAPPSATTRSPFNAAIYVPAHEERLCERLPRGSEAQGAAPTKAGFDRPNPTSAPEGEPNSSFVSLGSASNDGLDHDDTDNFPGNEEKGLCINCGTQLYEIKTKKKGIFHSTTKKIKIPLSIPGQVERGQCLQCGTSTACDEAVICNNSKNNCPASSVMEEDMRVEGVPLNSASVIPGQSNAVYEGPFNVYGERDGVGTMTWDNGDAYTGDFFNGNRHGHGTLAFKDGSEYVGEWECNRQHGVGTRRWNNGDCYTGQYQNGKRTGEGRFYFSNGDMYTGQWVSGVMQGFGRYYYASGQRFEGIFFQGIRKGKGKLQRTDGSLDIAVYSNDVRVGVGVRWSADRTVAWKMCDGLVKKKITVVEAVALDYDIDAVAEALEDDAGARVV